MYPDIAIVVYKRSKRQILERRFRRNRESAFLHTFQTGRFLILFERLVLLIMIGDFQNGETCRLSGSRQDCFSIPASFIGPVISQILPYVSPNSSVIGRGPSCIYSAI